MSRVTNQFDSPSTNNQTKIFSYLCRGDGIRSNAHGQHHHREQNHLHGNSLPIADIFTSSAKNGDTLHQMPNRLYLCILLYRLLKSCPSPTVRDWNPYTYWATGNFRVKDSLLSPKVGGAGVRGFTTGRTSSDDDAVQVLRVFAFLVGNSRRETVYQRHYVIPYKYQFKEMPKF